MTTAAMPLDVPFCSVGSLKGLPQRMTLRGERDMRVADLRAKLTDLTGNHRASAGLSR